MNNLIVIEREGQRVLTTQQLAESYGTTEKVISNNFNRNKERYAEGKHYICLSGDELKNFLQSSILGLQNSDKIRSLYLWTERGALLHAKSLNTNKAWEIYDYLVENYFQPKRQNPLPTSYKEALKQLIIELEEKEALQKQNDVMKPKADYFDDLVDRNLLTNFRDTAKELKVKEKVFIKYLMDNKYIYRDKKNQLRPYADKNKDLFEVKEYSSNNWSGVQTLITPKGRETFRLLIKDYLIKV